MAKKERKQRTNVCVTVQAAQESKLQEFYSRNLSSGGLFLEGKKPPAIGKILKLSFEVPIEKKKFNVEAKVLHHHTYTDTDENMNPIEKSGFGVQFLNLSKEDQELIEQFVRGREMHVSTD